MKKITLKKDNDINSREEYISIRAIKNKQDPTNSVSIDNFLIGSQKNEKLELGKDIIIYKRNMHSLHLCFRFKYTIFNDMLKPMNGNLYIINLLGDFLNYEWGYSYKIENYCFAQTYNKTLKALNNIKDDFFPSCLNQLVDSYVEDKDKPWL